MRVSGLVLGAASVFFGPVGLTAQELPGPESPALELIERARAARGNEADGLSSYEVVIRERLYIGLSISSFRRERGLLRSERIARARWETAGTETIEWLGARREVQIAGEGAKVEFGRDENLITYPLDPTGDRLRFGAEDFLHPLADSASHRYSYELGDTLRILLPALDWELVMVEVRFEPHEAEFELLAGSLWFDLESAALIRAVFRPSRPFDMEIDEPDEAKEVPGFLKPIVVEVDAIAVEYGLQDLRWWIAHRVRLEGVARIGSLLSVPVTMETVAEEVVLNAGQLDPTREPPDGWTRVSIDDDNQVGDPPDPDARRIIYTPPDSVLERSPYLSGDRFGHGSEAFSDDELDWLRNRLDAIAIHPNATRPQTAELGAWRYNRVEALSGAVTTRMSLGSVWTATGRLRIGLGDFVPNAELDFARKLGQGELKFRGYAALRSAADWGNPFSVNSSLSTLVLGYDDGQYFRSLGGDIGYESGGGSIRFDGRLFAEHHLAEEKQTNVAFPDLFGSTQLPPNLVADEVDTYGASGRIRSQAGFDADGWIVLGSVWGEVATGTGDYARLASSFSASHPVARRLAAAVDISAGTSWGDVPVQREWLLGGPTTLRAIPGGSVAGAAFWLSRFELAYGLPLVRVAAFTDVGWAGRRNLFLVEDPVVSAGVGISLLDGIVRVDFRSSRMLDYERHPPRAGEGRMHPQPRGGPARRFIRCCCDWNGSRNAGWWPGPDPGGDCSNRCVRS